LVPFGTSCVDLVHFSGFGTMYREKSGNPEHKGRRTKVAISQIRRGSFPLNDLGRKKVIFLPTKKNGKSAKWLKP
jgi:hypothetical protein